jgi:hypothetical protein
MPLRLTTLSLTQLKPKLGKLVLWMDVDVVLMLVLLANLKAQPMSVLLVLLLWTNVWPVLLLLPVQLVVVPSLKLLLVALLVLLLLIVDLEIMLTLLPISVRLALLPWTNVLPVLIILEFLFHVQLAEEPSLKLLLTACADTTDALC